jgi:DNA polymerase-3 subunit gamma/tau
MRYQALYRRYRPQRFSEIVGQDHVVDTLQREITEDKVAHAYLFTGPRGTGKVSRTTNARRVSPSPTARRST